MEDREAPPPYLGDYPHGAYWSAVAPTDAPNDDDEDDSSVAGSALRVMWDHGAGPLWADEGLLPDDPEWLRRALGLSPSLVSELLTWLSDMTGFQDRPTGDWAARARQLDRQGRRLAGRVQDEVGFRFTVRYDA